MHCRSRPQGLQLSLLTRGVAQFADDWQEWVANVDDYIEDTWVSRPALLGAASLPVAFLGTGLTELRADRLLLQAQGARQQVRAQQTRPAPHSPRQWQRLRQLRLRRLSTEIRAGGVTFLTVGCACCVCRGVQPATQAAADDCRAQTAYILSVNTLILSGADSVPLQAPSAVQAGACRPLCRTPTLDTRVRADTGGTCGVNDCTVRAPPPAQSCLLLHGWPQRPLRAGHLRWTGQVQVLGAQWVPRPRLHAVSGEAPCKWPTGCTSAC